MRTRTCKVLVPSVRRPQIVQLVLHNLVPVHHVVDLVVVKELLVLLFPYQSIHDLSIRRLLGELMLLLLLMVRSRLQLLLLLLLSVRLLWLLLLLRRPKVLIAVLLQVVQDGHELLRFLVYRVLNGLVKDGHVVGDIVDGGEVHVVGVLSELDGGGGGHGLLGRGGRQKASWRRHHDWRS